MRAHVVAFAVYFVAAVTAQIVATYLVNNVRAVRNFTGPL